MLKHHVGSTEQKPLNFLWLEITGRCQLECTHCYAASGPTGTHGQMTKDDWSRIIEDAAGLGVESLQFIGGEPTLHPDFPDLLKLAVKNGIEVEVFSNLVHITPSLWNLFSETGVSLATSWYSDDANEHAAITNRKSFELTKASIDEAVRRDIPLRVGIIGVQEGQRVDQAKQVLIDLGVDENKIGYDKLRQVGRGVRDFQPGPDQLCGKCADGVLAVSPSGDVWPCVFSRWMTLGNVLEKSLPELIEGKEVAKAREQLKDFFMYMGSSDDDDECGPDSRCNPECPPRCSPSCNPCAPSRRCWPDYK
ncbi:radical SAM/SPASM domain-containing protein [Lihuaxuella thermophila]|uniref:Radical SAM superfamily enzyme, MoaA/NifB/PqqE/SkfB family n=1 Tax=Lihuaxuella thermophila TaxID=1173111 RepID=A0A1H8AVZ4_9BACL|nr:radical SAM protein [Lihuaxuella thermophila]SEM74646.1 Radical SAM superfamily enzyme, MoaA/NifB/PqqE/SkfB family [Lihuaxuella thermophila]